MMIKSQRITFNMNCLLFFFIHVAIIEATFKIICLQKFPEYNNTFIFFMKWDMIKGSFIEIGVDIKYVILLMYIYQIYLISLFFLSY